MYLKPRDPERIAPLLAELEAVWEVNSDMRLGQLIVNVTYGDALFYIEDDALIQKLKEKFG